MARMTRIVALVLTFLAATTNSNSTVEGNNDVKDCGLYLAVSSTSTIDGSKWGVYAGKDYESGVSIGYPEIAVNVINFQSNAGMDYENREDDASELSLLFQTVEFFEQLVWVPIPGGAKFELEEGRVISAIPGAGVLGGFNPKLTNADWNHTSAYLRPNIGEIPEKTHPGRGAYSNFFNVQLRSKIYIPAGREIFMEFGDNWEEENKDEELEKEDYEKLDQTVDKILALFTKYEHELSSRARRELYDFFIRDVMEAAIGKGKTKKIIDILPSDPDMLVQVKQKGGSLSFSQPSSHRKLQWLQEHGMCMDNIKPGPSTVPDAGRGAFAARPISKDSLVAPIPLAQILDREALDMHEPGMTTQSFSGPREDAFHKLGDETTGKQLMLNYCYGHPKSSLLFYPTGATASFINHSSEPNARMVWSSHHAHQKDWLHLSPNELLSDNNAYVGLVMEIIALRDIQEDEEVFIDYGTEWIDAWGQHQHKWNEKVSRGEIPSQWPLRAIDLNDIYMGKKYETETELKILGEPYPENVMLKCFAEVYEDKEGEVEVDQNIDGFTVKSWKPSKEYIFDGDELYDCTIIGRERLKMDDNKKDKESHDPALNKMPYKYKVKRGKANESKDEDEIVVSGVPHYAFTFVDKPATGDQFYPHSFRHYIGIPDDVFPQGTWRDLGD